LYNLSVSKCAVLLTLALLSAACRSKPSGNLAKLTEEFVYTTLSFTPSAAIGAGLHDYRNQKLDDLLDDLSPASLDRRRKWYEEFQARLKAISAEGLTAEDRADLAILEDQTALALLDLTSIQTPLHNPTLYVESLGRALFDPFVLEYAPKAQRIQSIIARLGHVPLFLDQASGNLASAPEIWVQVAIEENQGNIDLVDKTIRAGVPDDMKDLYARAAMPALEALNKFQSFLKTSLLVRNQWQWQLGPERYTRKFRLALESGVEADTTLQQAERDLERVRARMLNLALPIHRTLAPAHKDHDDLPAEARQNAVIGEVLNKIAERHSTGESYMDDARKNLDEARAFVQQKALLRLPQRSNLQVIPTPEFMRGIYAVGGFNSAPPLEPQLGAFYWVTPIPESWPKERVDSKLREYNFYNLKLLTIHEAMPGHYVQIEIANDVQPLSRRLLRSVYGNGPYVEGWAQYATQVMLEQGFLNNSPELALTFAKQELRVIANAILDVRLHMLGMKDEEALDLMMRQTFQEKEEATAKLQRAKLSCQLPTYFVGWRGWNRLRDEYRQAKGSAFNLAAFHDAALSKGAVPLPVLGRLLP
jgi:uncharacterized protein (DUF885 family)